MRKRTIVALFLFGLITLNAQDKITLKNGKEVSVYILDKNDTEIKYKQNDSISQTTFTTKLNNLKTINYANGEVDLLSSRNPRSIFPLGINGGVSLVASEYEGGGMFTGGIDYLFTPNISAGINLGSGGESDFYYSFGGKYWIANKYSKSGFSPFAGLLYGGIYGLNFWEIPVGISYITKLGFQSSFHLSYIQLINGTLNYETNRLNAELRIGWRFK